MAKRLKIMATNEPAPKPEGAREANSDSMRRTFTAETVGVDSNKRTLDLSFSSELPVKRYDWCADKEYNEVLSHNPGDCDLSRLNNGHPLLLNHDTYQQIGVVEGARIGEDKKGRATVRFSKSQLGDEIWTDVKDGIRRLVSVGYRRLKELATETKDGVETRRYSWQPYEVSIVPVPADATVGVGRNSSESQKPPASEPPAPSDKRKISIMAENAENKIDPKDIVAQERKRVSDINTIAARMSDRIPNCAETCQKAIAEGTSVAELQDKLFNMLPEKTPVGRANLDIPEKDQKRYSVANAIYRMACGKQVEGLERELSQEVAKQMGRDPEGFFIPHQLLGTRADNIVGTATLGGNLVATNLLAGQFIDILRNRAWVAKLGANMLDGLVGNVVIPRQSTAATVAWKTEIEAAAQTNTAFDQLTLTPKCVTAYEVYSKLLLAQSTPSVDSLIRDDLLKQLALAIDKAALVTASGGPTSIIGTTGIATVTCGAAGIIPTFANMVSLESAVALGNADVGSLAYLTNPAVRGALRTAVKSTYSGAYGFIWEQEGEQGRVNGYRAEVTNQLVRNNTVGTLTTVCSSIFFGNWADLVIGTWGGTDVVVDPYSAAGTREIKIYASNFVDLGVRHPASFAVILDALSA